MMESKVFADNFSRSFSESGDFFQFLSARQARSKWMTAPSKELRFEPVERGSTLGNLYMQIYDHNGDADVLEDTMENTSLLLKVDGKDYPVRSCAIKTVLERARISGHALNKVSKTVFAEILNYCMGVASGDSLIKIADEKVSAVHGGDPKDYTVMEMLPLFKATSDFLNREYPGNTFMTAHFDHSIATAIWRLDGQADNLLDTYHREIAAKGLQTEKMVPALRFSTSDVGMSGANLYPIFLVGAESRIVPLGYSIRTEHKNGVDMQYFEELQEHISAVVELDRCLSEIQQVPYQKINVAKCEQRREKLAAEIARYRELKASLYEDMKEGLISKTDFCDIRGQYDVRIADALIAQEQIDRELSIYLSGEQSPNNWMKTFTEHRGLKSLTRAVVLECIEKVVIHKGEKLEIIFEHSEDYARLVSSLQE